MKPAIDTDIIGYLAGVAAEVYPDLDSDQIRTVFVRSDFKRSEYGEAYHESATYLVAIDAEDMSDRHAFVRALPAEEVDINGRTYRQSVYQAEQFNFQDLSHIKGVALYVRFDFEVM